MAFERVREVAYTYRCLSTDTKPTDGVARDKDTVYETNTGQAYFFDGPNNEWVKSFDTPTLPDWMDAQSKTISSNAISISSMAKVVLVTISATGTLTTVTGLKPSQELILKAASTVTLTIDSTSSSFSMSLGDSVVNDTSEAWFGYYTGTTIQEIARP